MPLQHPAVTDPLGFLRSVLHCRIRIDEYQGAIDDYALYAAYGGGGVPTLRRSDRHNKSRLEEIITGRMAELSDLLTQAKDQYIKDRKIAMEIMLRIPDSPYRNLLIWRYIKGQYMDDIAQKLGVTLLKTFCLHTMALAIFSEAAQ